MKDHRTGSGSWRYWLGAAAALALLGGCHGDATIAQGEIYPRTLARGQTLNIQVFRRETHIEFTNTTARNFGPGRLWLNGWYSCDLPSLAIGETVNLPLRDFKDRFGGSFRSGGFFATEPAERLALAEIQVGGEMLGMIVVGGDEQ